MKCKDGKLIGRKMIKVMTSGVFDTLHLGHINILTRAKQQGDYLIVGIQDDESAKKSKGKYPTLNFEEREKQVKALPFVDEIVKYSDVDQRELWSKIKPNIVVQGDDYVHSGDRTNALLYLKEQNIRLMLFPRTEGISSTEIKQRIIYDDRKDVEHINNLKILPIEKLKIYEDYDDKKVKILKEKIEKEKIFFNPITVGVHEDLQIVVDGNNRLQAMKELEFEYIPCLCIPYKDIWLTNNVHFKKNNQITRLSEFSIPDGERIEFKKYTHADIINAVKNNTKIPNGETWHKPPYYIVNLPIPTKDINKNFDLQGFIKKLVDKNNIRFYPNSVYSCNEWNPND
tara:strand:+ start:14566 stop:15591 length:1026 start_codon:yes stop_codon:yes gene_type:complete